MATSVNSVLNVIGPYKVLKTLGEGGFGKVFLVEKGGWNFALKRFEVEAHQNKTL